MAESKWRDSYLKYKARGKILNENISNSLIAILHGMKIFCLHICVEKMEYTLYSMPSELSLWNNERMNDCILFGCLPFNIFIAIAFFPPFFFWFVYEKIPKSVNVYWKSIKFVLPEWKICFWYNYCAYLQAPALKTHPNPRNWILPHYEFIRTFGYTLAGGNTIYI